MSNITVILKVTNGCNLNCPYCYNKSRLGSSDKMSLDTLEKVLLNISLEYKSAEIIFHGGEPTLMGYEWYESAFKLIDKYKRMYGVNITTGIQTNFTIQNDKLYRLFIDNAVGIGISYDGVDNEYTRTNTDKILSNISKFKHSINRIGAITLVTKHNYDKILETEKHYIDVGIKDVQLNVVYDTSTMEKNLSDYNVENLVSEFTKIFKYTCGFEETIFDDNFVKYITMLAFDRNRLVCENTDCIGKWIAVHPDGNTYPCGQEWEQNKNYEFENILTNTFSDIFSSDKYIKYANTVRDKMDICKSTCEIYEICRGGCPAKSLANTGGIINNDEKYCYMIKNMLKNILNHILSGEKIINKKYLNYIGRIVDLYGL